MWEKYAQSHGFGIFGPGRARGRGDTGGGGGGGRAGNREPGSHISPRAVLGKVTKHSHASAALGH